MVIPYFPVMSCWGNVYVEEITEWLLLNPEKNQYESRFRSDRMKKMHNNLFKHFASQFLSSVRLYAVWYYGSVTKE